MHHVTEMLKSHPKPPENIDAVAACIEACLQCAATCTSCADACVAENNNAMMLSCIRLTQDCASVCLATAAVLSRSNAPNAQVIRAVVDACRQVCAACAAECEKHGDHMVHCKLCAAACRACETACAAVTGSSGIA